MIMGDVAMLFKQARICLRHDVYNHSTEQRVEMTRSELGKRHDAGMLRTLVLQVPIV